VNDQPVTSTFASLPLAPPLARAIEVLGFARMTPVQEHALPSLLAGKDVIAQARTGSGKTVAFGLALLSRIDIDLDRVQVLVLCPTRELADQVSTEVRRLARFIPNLRVVTLCGGVPVRSQTPSLQTAPHVIVGTPGRILDHLGRATLELSGLRVLVLDEADRMLDMGFLDSILEVVDQAPKVRQTLLFSATYPDEIRSLSRRLQRSPVEVTVDNVVSAAERGPLAPDYGSPEHLEAVATAAAVEYAVSAAEIAPAAQTVDEMMASHVAVPAILSLFIGMQAAASTNDPAAAAPPVAPRQSPPPGPPRR
jgi:superfamily II DNA/RNA helicase